MIRDYDGELRVTLPWDELLPHFEDVLAVADREPAADVSEALARLAERRTNAERYDFPDDLRERVNAWVEGAWSHTDAELDDALLGVAFPMDLPMLATLEQKATLEQTSAVRDVIADAIRELVDDATA